MSVNTPIYRGIAQSDLDMAGFDILNWSGGGGGGGGGLPEGWVSVMDYGAEADGVTDDTAAVQAAVAAATSVVYFPPGQYFFAGSIGTIPVGISLVGATQFGPRWSCYNLGSPVTPDFSGASVLMLTANAGNATGPKFIAATSNTAIVGLTFYWPNQVRTNATPTAYPWAIHIHNGNSSSVRFCEFVNAYQGIYLETGVNTNLIEEIRGEALYCGIKCEGNTSVTRLRGCYFDDQWSRGGAIAAYRGANAVAFAFGYNDMTLVENCFAYLYGNWIHAYDDPSHMGASSCSWIQVRGGGGDVCSVPVWIEQAQDHGVDLDGPSLTSAGGGPCLVIASSNTGAVRVHSCLMYSPVGTFATVAGSGQVSVDDTYHFCTLGGGIGPESFGGSVGWAVTGTGNFAMRDCHFRPDQTHVTLAATLTRAIVTGNLCTGTFNVTNNMTAGQFVIDNNSGGDTVYVGADARLVAVSGGTKLETRNTGTGVWVESARWTNP